MNQSLVVGGLGAGALVIGPLYVHEMTGRSRSGYCQWVVLSLGYGVPTTMTIAIHNPAVRLSYLTQSVTPCGRLICSQVVGWLGAGALVIGPLYVQEMTGGSRSGYSQWVVLSLVVGGLGAGALVIGPLYVQEMTGGSRSG
ncbi:hypothetical protein JYU34_015454 [Plutella xylostella]|uniref:Major facilitator superfamily (MFS) profile domain-containing protein n=1 Tax=Plutella xylostella TaxID=51655 RepID=A0ABQ7Q756_PLUXY|nr:hypothetical protein JYU34_015454 [Plutella xylostella]